MKKPQHTPGPRASKLVESNIPSLGGLIIKAGNAAICEMTGAGSISQANAAFIVKAVNCHDDLLEALNNLLEDITQGNHLAHAIEFAESVVTKANGE